METTVTTQERHERIINFLHQFNQYSPGGEPSLKIKPSPVGNSQLKDLDTNEINHAVVALVDILNLSGGSVNDVNLYRLLQAYFQIPQCRKDINQVVEKYKTSSNQRSHGDLSELIDQVVVATIEVDEETIEVKGYIIDVDVNTFYFHEKNEPVMISVSIFPIGELPKDIDPEYAHEYLSEIPLANIRKV